MAYACPFGALLELCQLHRKEVCTFPTSVGELAGKTRQDYLAVWEATLRRSRGTLRKKRGTLSCLGRSLTPPHESRRAAICPLVLCIPQTINLFLPLPKEEILSLETKGTR